MSDAIGRLTAPIRRRIRMMLSRAVGRLVDPTALLQTVQIELLKGELLDGVEHVEGYGRTAVPPDGWEGVAASLGGDRSHTVLLSAVHRGFRLRNLAPGEVALYDDLGNAVVLMRDRIRVTAVQHLEVTAPTCHITATTTHDGNVTIHGNLAVSGDIDAGGDITDHTGSVQGVRDTYNGHTHPGDSGGTTGVPDQGM